jgi:DNA-binding response OmpR family regulator
LIAEDDAMMADALGNFLTDNGYEVCGVAATVAEGIKLGKRFKPELAILDIRLSAGGHGREIAAGLKSDRNLGVLYVTGYNDTLGGWGLTRADGHACLNKPFRPVDLLRSLTIVEQMVSTGMASQPFPSGFHMFENSL